MKKILSLLLALTLIFSMGTFMVQAETTEATGVTTVEPTNYADKDTYGSVAVYRSKKYMDANVAVSPNTYTNNRAGATSANPLPAKSTYSNGMTSKTHLSNNRWLAFDLGETRTVSGLEIIQHYYKIKDCKIYYTNDADLIAEIKTFGEKNADFGLTKDGEISFRTQSNSTPVGTVSDWYDSTTQTPSTGSSYGKDMVYHGQGILDRLTLLKECLLSKPSYLEDGTFMNGEETVQIDTVSFEPVKARCFVLVADSDFQMGSSMMLWSFKALGTAEKTSTDIKQYPKTVINYADKSVYTSVKACSANDYEKQNNIGVVDTLVNPKSTVAMGSYGVLFQIPATADKNKKPYTWFAIDLGEVRSVGGIDIYQWKDRLAEVEVYSLTKDGWDEADENGGKILADDFMSNHATHLKTQSIYHTGTTTKDLNTKANLIDPDVINFENEVKTQYLLVRISEVVRGDAGVVLCEVHVKSTPIASYENAYPEGGIDYTVKFVNDGAIAKRYAIVEAQYNEAGEVIANNANYVNIDPLYAKSFAGKIEKVDGAKTIKVFSWCLDELKPLETEYTFNVQ